MTRDRPVLVGANREVSRYVLDERPVGLVSDPAPQLGGRAVEEEDRASGGEVDACAVRLV